jgi:hypothetical protein
MDLHLLSLVRGESGPFWPTRHERRLLKFALDRFGEMLTRFLLAGFGEEKVAPRWTFAITFIGADGTLQKRRLRIMTHEPADGSSCLPRGRDPLVLIALLRLLLHERRRADNTLVFKEANVIKLLGWADTEERRDEIDEAIGRYSLLFYEWGMNSFELGGRALDFYVVNERPLLGYRTISEETKEGRTERTYNRIEFSDGFIGGLLSRSLFGVAWDKVKSIKLTSDTRRRK